MMGDIEAEKNLKLVAAQASEPFLAACIHGARTAMDCFLEWYDELLKEGSRTRRRAERGSGVPATHDRYICAIERARLTHDILMAGIERRFGVDAYDRYYGTARADALLGRNVEGPRR